MQVQQLINTHRRSMNQHLGAYYKTLDELYACLLMVEEPNSMKYDYLMLQPEIQTYLREKEIQASGDKRTHDREFVFLGLPELDESSRKQLQRELLGDYTTVGVENAQGLL